MTTIKQYKYEVKMSARYRKGLRKMLRRGHDENKILEVIDKLASGIPLPPSNKDHPLHGDLDGLRECHVENDWLLIYALHNDVLFWLSTVQELIQTYLKYNHVTK